MWASPGIHRVRASIRDSAEGAGTVTCGTWDADNDEVAFWVVRYREAGALL